MKKKTDTSHIREVHINIDRLKSDHDRYLREICKHDNTTITKFFYDSIDRRIKEIEETEGIRIRSVADSLEDYEEIED